jgi:hypothetical protein
MTSSPTDLKQWQRLGWLAGVVTLIPTILALGLNYRPAFISYLVAFIFWFGLAVGCLNVAMIHHLTGGAWGNTTRRFFEAGYMTLPTLAVLFVPIIFGLRELYPWADSAMVAADKILRQKSAYENFPAFTVRAVFFFAILICIAVCLRKWSLQQDNSSDAVPFLKARTLSGPGIVIVPFVATFAYVDWVMSIEPSWFSTIFAVILLAGGVLVTLAMGIVLLAWFETETPFIGRVNQKQFLDLGNLTLAFVMFWTYVAFSQLLIIYSGNQPHEIGWYLRRIAGGWKWLLIFIALFQFLTPFFILLFRANKKDIHILARIAALIFFVNALENFWSIAPTFYPHGIRLHWSDFTAWVGIGGIWFAMFAANLGRHPLLFRPPPELIGAMPELNHER